MTARSIIGHFLCLCLLPFRSCNDYALTPNLMPLLIKALWQYRHFIVSTVITDLRLKFDRSILGSVWSVLNPLAQVAIFALILSNVLRAKIGDVDNQYSFALYLCAGLACWNLFNDIVIRSLTVFTANGDLIKKAAFPKIVLIAIMVCGCVVENLLLLTAVLALFLISGLNLTGLVLLIPALMLLTIALATGIGLILGVLNTFIRDIGQVTPILLQVLFWFTPIVYPISIVPEQLQRVMSLNPIYPLVSAYQKVLVFQLPPMGDALVVSLLLSIAILTAGGIVYSRAAPDMADVL